MWVPSWAIVKTEWKWVEGLLICFGWFQQFVSSSFPYAVFECHNEAIERAVLLVVKHHDSVELKCLDSYSNFAHSIIIIIVYTRQIY